jgi:ribonuclease R
MSEVDGTVQGHRDGHGFLVRDDGQADVYLAQQEMRAVLHRDRVKVRILRHDRKGRPEGRVLEILERRRSPIIGRLLHENGVWLVAPEDQRYGQDILVPNNATASATAGQVVALELTEPPSLFSQPVGRVVEVLGEIDDPGMEIEIAVRKYEVPHRFSPQALAQAASLPATIRATDRKHRVDLSDVALVTIDGEDARDFDDAVYCEPALIGKSGGRLGGERKGDRASGSAANGWRLLVAIADVSHYVKPGDPLDADAYERATSVYFPRRVIPMLPERISNGLCSLNPDEERLALVCDMLVTEAGDVHAYQFYAAVIRSQARLTYDEVAAILLNTRGAQAVKRDALVPHLLNLHGVYRALAKAREKRGAVDFATSETQIVCDANGRIEKIVPRTRNEAHRVIEEAMLAANVCAADFIGNAKHPALYRVHEGPTPERRLLLQNYLKALGLGLSISESPKPAEYQSIAAATRDRVDAQQIHTMLLRSMQQAIYTGVNAGHFGLAFDAYTHFTSPIRRYPDLLVHRVIHALLGGKRYHLVPADIVATPLQRKGAKPVKALGKEEQVWEAAGEHCSANERRADEASRDVEAWLKCRYMRERLGEEFGGTVSAVASFGLFVQLDSLYVEGLVHITELGGEYYRYDEVRQELRGERSGQRYAIGSRVRIQVSRVDLDGRRIDFRLVREGEAVPAPGRSRRERHAVPAQSAEEELAVLKGMDRSVKALAKHSAKRAAGKASKAGRAAPAARGKAVGKAGAGKTGKATRPKATAGKSRRA